MDSTNNKDVGNSKSFFSQLRRLANKLETGIVALNSAVESESHGSSDEDASVSAINLVLHTSQELKHMKKEAALVREDVAFKSKNISRIHDLLKDALQIHAENLERVEAYIEQYGYVRPATLQTVLESAAEKPVNQRSEESSEESGISEVAECKFEENEAVKILAQRIENVGAALKLEDCRSSLSQLVASTPTKGTQACSIPSQFRTPEPPKLFTSNSKLRHKEQINVCDKSVPGIDQNTSFVLGENSLTGTDDIRPNFRTTPETPSNVRHILNSVRKSATVSTPGPENLSYTCARRLDSNYPETLLETPKPHLLTCSFFNTEDAVSDQKHKENKDPENEVDTSFGLLEKGLHTARPRAGTPEIPILFTSQVNW